MSPEAFWPPRPGELLPRAGEATGVHDKLATYSLDPTNEDGGPKARGFALILGITAKDIDYLEGAIQTGILVAPVSSVRDNTPWGVNCVVIVPVRGRGKKRRNVINVRTAWRLTEAGGPPQIATILPTP